MKTPVLNLLILLLISALLGCKSNRNSVLAPEGSVPKRKALIFDPYGGYISIKTLDNQSLSGELIGLRNDSLFIWNDTLAYVDPERIAEARLIVYEPNNYSSGILMAIPNLFLFALAGEYGVGPIVMGLMFTAIDAIGVGMAYDTEYKKLNYYDWSEGRNLVLAYSRFPYGIPKTINLAEFEGRPKPLEQKK